MSTNALENTPNRPGKKRVPVAEKRRYFPAAPLKTPGRRSYTNKKKIQVLSFWATPSIIAEWDQEEEELRCPYIAEVSAYFAGIPKSCISSWRRDEELILQGNAQLGRRNKSCNSLGKWPDLEAELYERFLVQRAEGRIVRRGWFRAVSKEVFSLCYAHRSLSESSFLFSQGWFLGFLARHRISIRFTTNRAQKIPTDYLSPIIDYFRFVWRNAQPNSLEPMCKTGRYKLHRIVNMDQTPAPFEYLSGRTYAEKGSKTVWAKAEKSGWDKRQVTIQLTVLADGSMLQPWVIFRGKGHLPETEKEQYDSRVKVLFNEEGYANEEVILQWITEQLIPTVEWEPSLTVQLNSSSGCANSDTSTKEKPTSPYFP